MNFLNNYLPSFLTNNTFILWLFHSFFHIDQPNMDIYERTKQINMCLFMPMK
jgi:hypothetical protein